MKTISIICLTILMFQSFTTQGFAQGDSVEDFLTQYNTDIGLRNEFTSINGIVTTITPIFITLAGIVLLFMLISGGFTMMTSVSDPKAADAGKQRITAALTGFFLLFAAYWLIQALEIILGVTIIGN